MTLGFSGVRRTGISRSRGRAYTPRVAFDEPLHQVRGWPFCQGSHRWRMRYPGGPNEPEPSAASIASRCHRTSVSGRTNTSAARQRRHVWCWWESQLHKAGYLSRTSRIDLRAGAKCSGYIRKFLRVSSRLPACALFSCTVHRVQPALCSYVDRSLLDLFRTATKGR